MPPASKPDCAAEPFGAFLFREELEEEESDCFGSCPALGAARDNTTWKTRKPGTTRNLIPQFYVKELRGNVGVLHFPLIVGEVESLISI